MRYYKNKTTGEIIEIHNMRDLIIPLTQKARELGFTQFHYQTIYDVIAPSKILGNGIVSYCIPYTLLREHYKRTNIKEAHAKYPQFVQYRHEHLPKGTTEERLKVLNEQTF
jgi:hypothetical protein